MLAMISHIFCAHRSVPTYDLLYFQIPLVITRNLHCPRIEEVEGRHSTSGGKIRAESCIGSRRLPIQASRGRGGERTIEKHKRRIIWCVGQDVINSTGWNGITENAEPTADHGVLGAEGRPCEADLGLINDRRYRGKCGFQSRG